MMRTALSGPPWIWGFAWESPSIPRGPTIPSAMGRLGTPPREMLTWMIVPVIVGQTPLVCLLVVPPAGPGGPAQTRGSALHVVVERELVRMRPQPYGIRLVLAFVIDEGLDQLFGEDIALQQEGVIVFE